MADWKNKLYFGDNLDILREHVPDESVDLVYLDPPFNSNATYNVLFKEASGEGSTAQIHAFDDTWHWNEESERAYREVVTDGPKKLADLLQAMLSFLGRNDMMAYLTMMSQRMTELHRVLKPTGSIYLHCDPTASHYLKLLMDAVLGPTNFRTEITWKRTSAHNDAKQGRRQHGRIHDILLFYTKSDEWKWNPVYAAYDESYTEGFYKYVEPDTGRRYRLGDLTAAKPGGDTSYEWRVKRLVGGEWVADLSNEWQSPVPGWEYKGMPPYQGRYWGFSQEICANLLVKGGLAIPEPECRTTSVTSTRCWRVFARYMDGHPASDSTSKRTHGLPNAEAGGAVGAHHRGSSNEGDVVLDPFCGCGTAVAVAERLGRLWVGIDVTHLAISLMKSRLSGTFGSQLSAYDVVGVPQDIESARALATESEHDGRYQFEYWGLGLVEARPGNNRRKGRMPESTAISTSSTMIRARPRRRSCRSRAATSAERHRYAEGDMEREKAELGLLVTLEPPTRRCCKRPCRRGVRAGALP